MDYPSLNMGYSLISNCLRDQRETARSYTNRALTIFSVASAIIGIGLAFGFSITEIPHIWHNLLVEVLSILPVALYFILVRFAYLAIKPRHIETLDDPSGLDDKLLSLSAEDFVTEMIERIKNSFEENQKALSIKADSLTLLIPILILETVAVVSAVIVFSVF